MGLDMKELQEIAESIASLEKRRDALREENSKLYNENIELLNEVGKVKGDINLLKDEQQRQRELLADAQQKTDAALVEAREATAALEKVNSETQNTLNGIAQNEKELQKLKEEIKNYDQARCILEEETAKRRKKLDDDIVAFNSLVSAFDVEKSELKQAQAQLKEKEIEMTKKIADAEAVIVVNKGLEVELTSKAKDAALMDEALRKEVAKSVHLTKQNVDLVAQNTVKQESLDKAINEAEAQKVSYQRQFNDLQNLKNELDVKELRLTKLAKEKGIEKELASFK